VEDFTPAEGSPVIPATASTAAMDRASFLTNCTASTSAAVIASSAGGALWIKDCVFGAPQCPAGPHFVSVDTANDPVFGGVGVDVWVVASNESVPARPLESGKPESLGLLSLTDKAFVAIVSVRFQFMFSPLVYVGFTHLRL
jgi:hypothetical protein